VTMSVGLALSSEFAGSDVEEIIHQADMALYAAKAAGRNCVRVRRLEREEAPEDAKVVTKETTVFSR